MNALLLAATLAALPPPLAEYLKAARAHDHALGVSRAQIDEQEAAVDEALAALLPTLQANAYYQRNEYSAVFDLSRLPPGLALFGDVKTLAVQPYNQVGGGAGLLVPLLDAQRLYARREAVHGRAAAWQAARATEAEVLLATARAYWQVVAGQGIEEAAERALATARESLGVSRAMLASGTATRLAVDRARVDVDRAGEQIASAREALGLARRNLETLSGEPVNGPLPEPGESALPSGPEESFRAEAERDRPEVAQAREALARAEDVLGAAWARFAPSLAGSARESYTNAPGFLPSDWFWTAGVNLSWNLDPVGTTAAVRQARAAVTESRERLAQTLDQVRDEVHAAWLAVEADHARMEAASAESASAREALSLTQTQLKSGTVTSLDVSQANRDAFQADATLSQSRADLAAALLALEQAAGRPLLQDSP